MAKAPKRLFDDNYLTRTGQGDADAALTYEGMAHFANTGPAGKTCGDCRFFDYQQAKGYQSEHSDHALTKAPCLKAREISTGTARRKVKYPDIPARAFACRYFVQRREVR